MSKRISYLPKLDSLRAIAALMVLFSHYFVETGGPDFKYGGNGVQIFFVISGYLITGILLAQKESTELSTGKVYGKFIIRRALRLFPVYYLFLIGLTIISKFSGLWLADKGEMVYYYTYTQNYLFLVEGFKSSVLNHTWSLAVEEQFYLLWPLLLLFIPKRGELPLIVTVLLIGIISKIYFTYFFYTPGTIKGVTFIHFDTLGAGALLAWMLHNNKIRFINFVRNTANVGFILSFIVSGTLTYIGYFDGIFLPFSLMVMSVYLVVACTLTERTILEPLLNLKFLSSLGKVSYGLYLFHKPVPTFVDRLLEPTGWSVDAHPVIMFVVYFIVALAVTYLSWHLFEKRILKFKERFDA